MMAVNPRVIMSSFNKGTANTLSLAACAGFFNSIHLKKINNRKETLHINVNRDKNKSNFINFILLSRL